MIVRSSIQASMQPPIIPQTATNNESQANKIENPSAQTQTTQDAANTTTESSGAKRLEDIKNRIDNGTYELDTKATSQKMAQDLLLEPQNQR